MKYSASLFPENPPSPPFVKVGENEDGFAEVWAQAISEKWMRFHSSFVNASLKKILNPSGLYLSLIAWYGKGGTATRITIPKPLRHFISYCLPSAAALR